MMQNQNILISGASLAGPALAYWLSRYGFRPTVVERSPALRTGGYKVDIRGTAIDVAERMGILADIRKASTSITQGTFLNDKNKPIASLPADFLNNRGKRDDEVMREDLSRILYEHTRDKVEYIFDDSLTSITEGEHDVTVTFEHSQARVFDLVIGADGLHSNVRSLVFGEEACFSHHLNAYVSIFTTPNTLHLNHSEVYHYAPAGKFVSLYSAHDSDKAMSFCFFNAPPIDYDYRDSAQQKKILTSVFKEDAWQYIPYLLKAAQEAPDFYFDAVSQIQMDHWSKGRIALLGDAAYCASPASGQGTSLALVGAYILAGELAEAPGNHTLAFARYENAMRSFVIANQKLAGSVKDFIPETKRQIWLRLLAVRLLRYMPWKHLIASKMMREVQQAATCITLKNYVG
jgi:2-polyprenyl-6-methoxyphenol hydroxylase-like FAD-dependent oxidoreductase